MNQTATQSRNQPKVIAGAVLFMLAIVWGMGINRLANQTIIPASQLWYTALGVGAATAGSLWAWMMAQRRKNQAPPLGLKWAMQLAALVYCYCATAFGTLAVFLFLFINSLLATAPLQQIILPVEDSGSQTVNRTEDSYVVVTFEGHAQRIFLDSKSSAITAKYLHLSIQKGRFGYWVIRERSTSIFS